MSYTMYTPLNVWLDPASVTDVVAYIQTYLSENIIYSETEIEAIIHDYLIAHPELIGGVQSVNGKTGTVVLSASDINTEDDVTIESVLASLSSQISSIAASVATNTNNITSMTGRVSTAETDLANLKSNLSEVCYPEYTFTNGYKINGTNGGIGAVVTIEPTSNSSFAYTVADCTDGDVFTLTTIGGGSYRAWCWLDANNKIIDFAGTREYLNNVLIVAPSGSRKLIVHNDISKSITAHLYKGVAVAKNAFNNASINKRRIINPIWENGTITSSGLSNSSTTVRTFYSIRFNEGEALVVTCLSDEYKFAIYHAKRDTFYPVTNNFLNKKSQFTLTDSNEPYFIRVNRVDSSSSTPEAVNANFRVEIINTKADNYNHNVTTYESVEAKYSAVGYDRQYSLLNPVLNFQRKDVTNGELVDSTTRCTAELPKNCCIEIRSQDLYGAFKLTKITSGTAETLVDEWSTYIYRFVGDGESTYYLTVANANALTSALTIDEANANVHVYSFNDDGVEVDKIHSLYGKKLAFIGDSITQGRVLKFGATKPNATTPKPFGQIIAEMCCDFDYGNFGIGGATVHNRNWYSLYANCGKISGYDVVFVMGGTNDYGNDVTESNFRTAFSYVIDTLKQNNSRVIVLTPIVRTSKTAANDAGLFLVDYVSIEQEIALEKNVESINMFQLTNNGRFVNYLTDGLHPNEVGHRILADIIIEQCDLMSYSN